MFLFGSSIEKFHIHTLSYLHKNHLLLSENIANSSTPGFKAKKLEDKIDYKAFVQYLNNSKKIPGAKISYTDDPFKPNGNNVNEKEQYREMLSNENAIESQLSLLQEFTKLNEIVAGIRN